MKKTLSLILLLLSFTVLSQKFNFDEVLNFDEILRLQSKNFTEVEEYLSSKNWEFSYGIKPNKEKQTKGLLEFNYLLDNSKILYIYSHSGINNRIEITFYSKTKYNKYIDRIKSLGSILIISKIEDNNYVKIYRELVRTYEVTINSKNKYSTKTKYQIFIVNNEDYKNNFEN